MSDFEFPMKYCPRCKETKNAVLCFSLKGRICRDCAREHYKAHRGKGSDVMNTPWRGRYFSPSSNEFRKSNYGY